MLNSSNNLKKLSKGEETMSEISLRKSWPEISKNRFSSNYSGKDITNVPRIIISSTKGKSGKTLVTMVLLRQLIRKGYSVSVFKNGPDFIDPGYHQMVTGNYSRNLDFFLMGDSLKERFMRYSSGSDISLIEGNHGLYDSVDGISELGSTAQLAKELKAPVLMTLNGSKTNRTLGAIVRGMVNYDTELKIMGVVLTDVIPRQYEKIKNVIEKEGVPVLGAIYRDQQLERMMSYRHLGLIPVGETGGSSINDFLREYENPSINIPEIISGAKEYSRELSIQSHKLQDNPTPHSVNFGIIGGRAFSFYYPETIEKASSYGNIRFINAEKDSDLTGINVLLIGGGFPEIYAESLEKNRSLAKSIRTFSEKGGLIYAECGGLMYLTNSIVFNNNEFDMIGIIDGTATVSNKPVAHGYSIAKVVHETPIADKGEILRGHEFHYSRILLGREYNFMLSHEKGSGIKAGADGILVRNTYAHYMHLHPDVYDFVSKLAGKASLGHQYDFEDSP